MLRNGGLYINSEVQSSWQQITNPDNQPPIWTLSVVSDTDRPVVTSVTSYGYTDDKNLDPSSELNSLLTNLGLPVIVDRNDQTPPRSGFLKKQPATAGQPPALIQPAIHPEAEAYVTTQFSRIIQNQKPFDSETWSWLKGELSSGDLPVGRWNPVDGRVSLRWGSAGARYGGLGVRPSGRGRA